MALWVSKLSVDEQDDADIKIVEMASDMLKGTPECKSLVKSLTPLLETIRGSETAKAFLKSAGVFAFRNRFAASARRMRIFKEDARKSGTDEVTTLRKAFLYLALFETSVTNLIDLVIMLFVANGHDFYIYRHRKYAKKIDDLDESFLSEKLDFLNHHDLKIFSQYVNRSLRNTIAHMDFDIEADGKISTSENRFDLQREIVLLEAFVLIIGNALNECKLREMLNELS
jgi:hypothetical protein